MAVRDHSEAVITSFRGTFDRGEEDTTPVGFFLSSQNIQFLKDGVERRFGSKLSYAKPAIRRQAIYKRLGEAQRLLVLDSLGQLWDSVTNAIILAIPAMTDFSSVTIFDRAYITPHNGKTGLPGEKVYVYDGSGQARPAGGIAPLVGGVMAVADSAQSGTCEPGLHIMAVAFETVSGFITGYGFFTTNTPIGERKLDVSNIPIGPVGTVARVLVSTKVLGDTFVAGDFKNQTYYFIPNGRVAGNIATTATVDFYDADLQEEASYLFEQLGEIPAGVGISEYKAHMIVWGPNLSTSVIYVSRAGEPESINSVEGFVTVNPGDAGEGIKNCFEYRNQLIVCKSQRTYNTQDNGEEAAFWEVGEIDAAIGTECHGVGRSLDFGENVEDRVFIADRAGLRIFVGTFTDTGVLTVNIDDVWARINKAAFHTIEVCLDPINYRLYVAVPLDGAATPDTILYADYAEGISEAEIRWTVWKFPKRPTTVCVDVVNSIPVFKFGSLDDNVTELDPTLHLDTGVAIPFWTEFPLLPTGDLDESINHYTGIRLRIKGVGTLAISGRSLDSALTFNAIPLQLSTAPGRPLFRGFNFTSEHCSVKLSMTAPSSYFILTKFIIYISPVWEERPVVT